VKQKITVLLAVYNGEKYLKTLLDSVISQQDVQIELLIGDDGSFDESLKILSETLDNKIEYRLFHFNRFGTCRVFFELLSHASMPYIAFADQDDIWHKDHLSDAISRFSDNVNEPAILFSAVEEFGTSLPETRIFPYSSLASLTDLDFVFSNPARGCSIVINRQLKELALWRIPQRVVMHDWWIFLLGHFCGHSIFRETPKVMYRIHEENQIGVKGISYYERLKSLTSQEWMPLVQFYELMDLYGERFKTFEVLELFKFPLDQRNSHKNRLSRVTRILSKLNVGFLRRVYILVMLKKHLR
jgi:glycosyltransferase involved in cell wall biosynthesis